MAPNLLVKAAFVRGEFDNVKCDSEVNSVRTDFVLQNIYAYLIKECYKFDSVSAMNKNEEIVNRELKEIVDAFILNYDSAIKSLCSEIEVTEATVGSVLIGVSNELFSEGITWSRIVSLFVFVAELTLQYLHRNFSPTIVDMIYECFCRLVKERLKTWVDDHGGWEGIKSLSKPPSGNSDPLVDQPQSSNRSWAKSLLHNTVRMIGTIAHIANASNGQSLP